MTYDKALERIQSRLGYSLEKAKDFLFYLYDHFKGMDLDAVHDRVVGRAFRLRWWAFRYRFHIFYYPFYEDSWLDSLNAWLYRGITRHVEDWLFDRKMAGQRARRCFSERDVWNLDNWISETLADAIGRFADTCHTIPPQADAWRRGLDPDSHGRDMDDDTEEQTRLEAEWWKSYLRRLSTALRESNPYTCSFQDGRGLKTKWHFEPSVDVLGAFDFVQDGTDEVAGLRGWEREIELRKYYRAQFANAMKMLAMVYGELND